MPVTRIKVKFDSVFVRDDADLWGVGEWKFRASVDGQPVGDRNREFEARERTWIDLPEAEWSVEVDVSDKGPGTRVPIRFSGIDVDVFGDDDLGEVTAELAYPYLREFTFLLASPEVSGGLFFPDYRAYALQITVSRVETVASTDLDGPSSISVTRQPNGSNAFSTITGDALTPRIEVCPVIPVPNAPSRLPRRPAQPTGLEPGRATEHAAPITLTPVPALNTKVNPSLIPILSATDPQLNSKIARLAVTWVEPGNIDTSILTWHVTSGPAVIHGSNRGPLVKVRGTGSGPDEIAEFEVRWDGNPDNVVAKHRAWVGKIGRVPYRINVLNGSTDASLASMFLGPEDVDGHLQVARLYFYQAGLLFEPDSDTTVYESAMADASVSGVYFVDVTRNSHTRNVNMNGVPPATRYNFRPGVINIAYVRSTLQDRAVASDIQGVTGEDETLDGSPSASWVRPSGIPLDGDAAPVTMKTFGSSNRRRRRAPGDPAFIRARTAVDSSFSAASMDQLYACMLPADWGNPDVQAQSGANLAHELGHVLGLQHRGSGDARRPPRSEDGVNSRDLRGRTRGHPWHENVMTYGYGGQANPPRNLDIDLIQTPVIRRHAAVIYD